MEFLYRLFIRKKIGAKIVFFLGEKWFWKFPFSKKIFFSDFPIFSIEKSNFSIEKIGKSGKNIFFENRNFQNHFSPRKKKFFAPIFFLMKNLYLYFRLRCSLYPYHSGSPNGGGVSLKPPKKCRNHWLLQWGLHMNSYHE